MGSTSFILTVSVVYFAFMFFVRAALIDESEPSAYLDKRGDLARALYELQADPRNNYQNYDRALRSNGKPTFIRFGKRSFLGEVPNATR